MSETTSPFYPPRSRWPRWCASAWMALGQELRLDQARLTKEVTFFRFLISLVVPGYTLFLFRRPAWGWLMLAGWAVAALVFLALLGCPAGAVAFGLMIAAHVTSALFLLKRTVLGDDETQRVFSVVLTLVLGASAFHWFVLRGGEREDGLMDTALTAMFGVMAFALVVRWVLARVTRNGAALASRFILSVGTLVFYCACFYWPLLGQIESRLFVPLRLEDRVVVVNRLAKLHAARRGDWVLFRIEEHGANGVQLAPGYGFEKVLALPGETVSFTALHYEVNGQTFRRLPAMPASGVWFVPEKHWFVWPRLDISGNRSAADPVVLAVLQRTAMVSKKQFVGRPFRWWFGRRQVLP